MPTISFDYKGNHFDLTMKEGFDKLPQAQQQRIAIDYVEKRYGDKPAKRFDKGSVLDWIGLIERPIQAIKVGAKESDIGGNIFRGMGGVDLTPEEGFFTGIAKGWTGDDEVRTQDFLPDDMDPAVKGVLGFAGDVATDPITYMGGSIFKGIAAGGRKARAAVPRSVANKLAKYKDKTLDTEFMGYGLQDIARGLNVPIGKGKAIKGLGIQSGEQAGQRSIAMMKAIQELSDSISRRASSSGEDIEKIRAAFRNYSERPGYTDIETGFNPLTKIGDEKAVAAGKAISPEQAKEIEEYKRLMGDELLEKADDFQDIAIQMANVERAYGIPVQLLEKMGYFPHAATKYGRKRAALDNILEPRHPITGVPLNAGYMLERSGIGTVDDINLEKLSALGSKTPNPTDHAWEMAYGDRVLHTDPVIAWGRRWTQHNDSLQRKWFIDEVTDADLLGRDIAGMKKYMPTDATGRMSQPRTHGFGRWIRRNKDTGDYEQLARSINGNRQWAPLTDDMREWTAVDFVSDKTYRTPSAYKQLENDLAKDIEVKLRDDAVMAGDILSDYRIDKLQGQARLQASKEIDSLISSETMQFKVPTQIARQMKDTLAFMTGEREVGKFFKVYDQIQDAWKSWTLAIRPGYHTRNAVGNIFNAYMVGGLGANLPEAVKTFKDAAKVQYYSRFDGDDLFRAETVNNIRNVRGTRASKVDRAALSGMPKISKSEWTRPNFAGTGFSMEQIARNAKMRGINAGHYHKDIIKDIENKLELASDPAQSAKLKKFFVDNPLVEAGFAFGGTIEGNARYALFLDTLRKIKKNPAAFHWISPTGERVALTEKALKKYSKPILEDEYVPITGEKAFVQSERHVNLDDAMFDVASQKVKEALFDYNDLSRFERNVMKRAMPFYTWSRKNIPTQLKSLVLNPQRAEKIEIARQQFEHNNGGYDSSEYGAFWGDRVPVFLGNETNGVVKAFTLLNTLPMADLQRVLKPTHLIAEMVSPIPKTIFEQLFNYDSFRSRAGQVKPIREEWQDSKDFLGVALPPTLWHLAQLIVPLTELNRMNPAGVFGQKTLDPQTRQVEVTSAFGGYGASRESNPADIPEAARWFRFLTGGRIYDVDMRQQKYYMNKNAEKDLSMLKNKLKWAVRKNESRKARQIMEFIEEVQRQNLTDRYNR